MSAPIRAADRTAAHLFEFRTATFEVPAALAGAVAEAAADLVRESQCQTGTRLFTVLRDRDRPTRFQCAAVFDDAAAERALFATPGAHRLAAVLLSAGVSMDPVSWEVVAGI